MRFLTNITLLLLGVFSKADYCQDNFTLSELPSGVIREAVSIFTTGTVIEFLGCPKNTNLSRNVVKLWLYSRRNPDIPILLDPNNPVQLDPSKPIKILAPGWLCNVTNDRMPELKNAYLERYDCNVIGIDWSKLSIDLYTSSFCNVPAVAKIVGKFTCKLHLILHVAIEKIHVIGHSMGGQLAGLIGQEVQSQCKQKLGRITALDPAGPLYQDVIHTNMAFLGYFGSCGTVDFFPNCGTHQPGCFNVNYNNCIHDIIHLPTKFAGCNHFRSADYMTESITSGNFKATSCRRCPGLPAIGPCIGDANFQFTTIMGEDCPVHTTHTKYTLETNSKPPFAQG